LLPCAAFLSQVQGHVESGQQLAQAAAAAVQAKALACGAYDNVTAVKMLLDW
jgi:hypothetical protein